MPNCGRRSIADISWSDETLFTGVTCLTLCVCVCVCVCVCFFLGLHPRHMEIPRLGVESELQLRPTPQPQQRRIRSPPVTYTTAHGNARTLTY